MRNTGTSDVQLRGVHLVKPVALEVLDARVLVLAAGQADLVGMSATYPPTDTELAASGIVWSSVREAGNFTVPPGATANLVLELTRTTAGTAGTAQATEIEYTANGKTYRTTTNTIIRLAAAASC